MKVKFEVLFLEQAIEFVETLDSKTRNKIYYNIDKAKLINNPKLFKKLEGEIWEFRTKYNGIQYRLFAFWDKTERTWIFRSYCATYSGHIVPHKTDVISRPNLHINL